MNTVSSAIADLQAKWHSLPDYDRAQAVLPIIRAGVSRRQLAIDLGTSEGSVRILLLILEADPFDLESFRQGRISRNELIRRVKGTFARPQSESARIADGDLSQLQPGTVPLFHNPGITDPANGCEAILDWFREDPVCDAHAAEILAEACRIVDAAETRDRLPRERAPVGMTAKEIFRRCRPDPSRFGFWLAWYADWLAISVVYLIPESELRSHALRMAIDTVAEDVDRRSFGRSSLAA